MAKIETFEDIKAWQKARQLNIDVYKATNKDLFSRDFALRDQIRRSSISVLSNIAEGFERESKQEFIRFLSIAKASCGELRAQLYIAYDLKYLSKEEFESLLNTALEVSKMLGGFMTYLKEYKANYNVSEPDIEYLSNLKGK
jgi:four helix bundle protein